MNMRSLFNVAWQALDPQCLPLDPHHARHHHRCRRGHHLDGDRQRRPSAAVAAQLARLGSNLDRRRARKHHPEWSEPGLRRAPIAAMPSDATAIAAADTGRGGRRAAGRHVGAGRCGRQQLGDANSWHDPIVASGTCLDDWRAADSSRSDAKSEMAKVAVLGQTVVTNLFPTTEPSWPNGSSSATCPSKSLGSSRQRVRQALAGIRTIRWSSPSTRCRFGSRAKTG